MAKIIHHKLTKETRETLRRLEQRVLDATGFSDKAMEQGALVAVEKSLGVHDPSAPFPRWTLPYEILRPANRSYLLMSLDAAVKKHGAKTPLTIDHLRNIVALTEYLEERKADRDAEISAAIDADFFEDMMRYGSS